MNGIRKGPWMSEEDAVLMEYVKKHGPRDWSSIRSKGLLPRSGKSCRLRWVNKLNAGLKTGCKFSTEEERIVIDLQGSFGNKWARIATYLPGRTDNDVKNFWSTRQKRLARLLQTPLSTDRVPHLVEQNMSSTDPPCNPPCLELISYKQDCSNSRCGYVESSDTKEVTIVNPDATLPLLEPTITDCVPCFCPTHQLPFDYSLLDLPLIPEGQDLVSEFDDLILPDHFTCLESCQSMQLPVAPTFFNLDVGGHDVRIKNPETPEICFDDFPADMFEYLEPPPPPPLPPGYRRP